MERRAAERKRFGNSLIYDMGATPGKSGVRIHKAKAHDICADGIRIVTSTPLEKGLVIRLGLPASGSDACIPAFAEVVWTIPYGSRFKVGMRFLK